MWGARLRATSVLVAVLLVTVSLTESAEVLVGGNTTGWTTGFNYDTWLTSQNIQFRVGDTLDFRNFDELTHTVALLNDSNSYQMCLLGAAFNITPVPSGTNYTLTIPATLEGGTLYVVCTVSGHCTEMQKIHGTVLAALGNASAPASTAAPGTSDADMNQYICWTTAILLIAACFWNSG